MEDKKKSVVQDPESLEFAAFIAEMAVGFHAIGGLENDLDRAKDKMEGAKNRLINLIKDRLGWYREAMRKYINWYREVYTEEYRKENEHNWSQWDSEYEWPPSTAGPGSSPMCFCEWRGAERELQVMLEVIEDLFKEKEAG